MCLIFSINTPHVSFQVQSLVKLGAFSLGGNAVGPDTLAGALEVNTSGVIKVRLCV